MVCVKALVCPKNCLLTTKRPRSQLSTRIALMKMQKPGGQTRKTALTRKQRSQLHSSVCTLFKAWIHQFLIDSWNKHFINNDTCDYKVESISSVYFFKSTSADADNQCCDS